MGKRRIAVPLLVIAVAIIPLLLLPLVPLVGSASAASSVGTSTGATPSPAVSLLGSVSVGDAPRHLAVDPITNRIFVANLLGRSVSVINGNTNAVIATIPVGSPALGGPDDVAVNPNNKKVYAAGPDVTVIKNDPTDPATDLTVLADVSTGVNGHTRIAVNTTTNLVYAAQAYGNGVAVINSATDTLVTTISAAQGLPVIASFFGLAANPATNLIYVTRLNSGTVYVIDGDPSRPTYHTVIETVATPADQSEGIAVNHLTNRIYVGHGSSFSTLYSLSVIQGSGSASGTGNTLLTNITFGATPQGNAAFGVAVNPARNLVYVVPSVLTFNFCVVDGATNASTCPQVIGGNAWGTGVNPVSNRAYVARVSADDVAVVSDTPPAADPWAWGTNSWDADGQLGDGTTTERWTPVQVKGPGGVGFLTGVVAISAGAGHSLALRYPLPVDTVPPTVASINRVTSTPTGASSVQWTVTFSESVTGVDAADFSLVTTGVSGASITSVNGSGSSYTVTASTGSGDGTLGLNLVDNDSIQDAAGNKLGGTGAGNGNFTGQVYTIARTPPEAYNQFDPATKDVLVFGRDSGSGVPPGPIAPVLVTPTKWGDSDDDDEEDKAELRTYRVTDAAGNILVLVEKVKKAGHEIKVKVMSLQYSNGPVIVPPQNKKSFEWSVERDGTLKELEQEMEVGKGKDKQEVEAKHEAKKNQTTIKIDEPKPETKIVQPGLVLLRMATRNGKLVIEY